MCWARHSEGVDPCSMNVLSTRPVAASIFSLVLASCHPITSSDPHIKTVVWDIHGAPPASGHALLVQPAAPNDGMRPNQWTLLSDTLRWDPSTGELEWPHVPLDSWWHIESSDPCQTGTTRVDRFPAATDTCRMTSQTTLHLSGKMHRTLGTPVTGYHLDFKAAGVGPWKKAETWNMNRGMIQRVLHLPLGEGPWSFRLLRLHDGHPPRVIHDTTTTTCEHDGWSWTWNDLDTSTTQP